MGTITMKFGGTSVGSADAMSQVMQIVADSLADGNRVAVVVSAMSGVTNLLLKTVEAAKTGDKWTYTEVSQEIREKHEEAAELLISDEEVRDQFIAKLDKMLEQHIELCTAIGTLGEVTPRIADAIVSFGERLSSRLISAAMKERNINAKQFDSSQFIITNHNYQDADPLWDVTEKNIREQLLPQLDEGIVPIITGFIGSTPDGVITTLGRGGSDFSAAIFAAYLDSDELIIWTDVDGVMTTDPRIDKRARVLPNVSYQEVGEMAFYGAKVLHPKTVQPIISQEIPLRVRNTFNPTHPGTLITATPTPSDTVIKAVTSIRNVSMLTVSGKGMLGVPGIAGRTFLATADSGASILMISQSSSEQNFCFIVTDGQADGVKGSVESELAKEIEDQDVDSVSITSDIVIVTVVGAGMRGTMGVAGRVFTTMGDNGINVLAIAQGSSECSISFVVNENDLEHAVSSLHELALQAVPA